MLSALVDAGTRVHLRAGAWLVRAGEAGDQLFVIESGRLEVVVVDGGTARRIRVLGPGAVVGELALLCEAPRAASVRALRDSTLVAVSRDVFEHQLRGDTKLALALVRSLAEKLRTRASLAEGGRRPKVIAVVSFDGAAPVPEIAAAIGQAISRSDDVASVALDAAGQNESEWSRHLDSLERDHGFVLLVGDRDEPRSRWSEFCARQADLVLSVVGEMPGSEIPLPTSELVLHGRAAELTGIRRWVEQVGPQTRHRVRDRVWAADIERLARRLTGRSVGIVLSGGGARGLAHLGALDVLDEAGLQIDRVGGTSMGALIGALFAAGYAPAAMLHMCRAELVDRNPFRDYTVPRVALIRARRARLMLERLFGSARLEDLSRGCFSVSADLNVAEVVVHRDGPVVEAVGASMSLPGLAPPVRSGRRFLVDGGVLNNVPVDVMAADGEGPVVAVDVMVHGAVGHNQGRMPSIVETLARASVLGSHAQAAARLAAARAVIAPELGTVSLLEFSRFDEIVAAGRTAARRAIEAGMLDRLGAPT
jgi:predicted acylesterase/phospholipase RssA